MTARNGRPLVLLPQHSITPLHRYKTPVPLRKLGVLPPVSGGATGYHTEGDLLTQTADGRDLNEVWNEIRAALAIWNQSRSTLVNLMTFPVAQPTESVPQFGTMRFEKASEFGTPKKQRAGGYFELGYDFEDRDLGIGFTWKFLRDATAGQIDNITNGVLEADNRQILDEVLRAVFNNANRVADINNRSINVYPFYNADAAVPPPFKASEFTAPHNHYMVSGGATVDSGDLDDMETNIIEHGYGTDGGASMVLLVNRAQLATIRGFKQATGASYDYVPSLGMPPFLLPTNTGGIANGQPPSQYNGMRVAGQYGPWLIIEESYIPAGYMLGFATGGQLAATNPVGFREHQNPAYRGLLLVKGQTPDYPLIDSYYERGFGTGVRHRGAGVVMQVKASGSYDIPAAYA